jgi:hypothetical protein
VEQRYFVVGNDAPEYERGYGDGVRAGIRQCIAAVDSKNDFRAKRTAARILNILRGLLQIADHPKENQRCKL